MTRECLYVALSRGRAANRAYVVTDEALDVDLHVPPGPRLDALDVLRGVLARESSERSATESISASLEAAESLATLVPQYLDGFARAVVTDDLEASVRAGLRDAGGGDLEDRVSAAPAWRHLVVACAGEEPRALAGEAVRSRLLDSRDPVEDPAAVLAWRVQRLMAGGDPAERGATATATATGEVAGEAVSGSAVSGDADARDAFRPRWVPAPCRVMTGSSVGQWAIQQDRLIGGRVRAMVERVAAHPPTWASGIRPRPAPGAERDRWEAHVGVVAAYRDPFRITDDADPLGAARVRGHQHPARQTARVAWGRVPDHGHVHDQSPASVNDRLRALSSSQRDPIGAGQALSRLRAAQRSHIRERPNERPGIGAPTRGPSL